MSAVCEDKDWRENKKLILESLSRLDRKVDALSTTVQQGLAELRTEIEVIKASFSNVTREELESIVTDVANSKRNPSQTLTRDEIRRIAEESVRAKNGTKKSAWEPWQYTLLGAAIVLGGVKLFDLAARLLVPLP